jgi:hypothetical protein
MLTLRTAPRESEALRRVFRMRVGSEEPVVRHYLRANRGSTALRFGQAWKLIEPWLTKAMEVARESEKGGDIERKQHRSENPGEG